MSIDLNWETLTGGADGEALAERIRSFIHEKFQTVPLPRFIRSVEVHGFDFGGVAPELELKDVTDPLPDFYEQDIGEDEDEEEREEGGRGEAALFGGGRYEGARGEAARYGGGRGEAAQLDGRPLEGARYQGGETRYEREQQARRNRPPPPSPLGVSRSAAVAAAAALTLRGEGGDMASPFLGSSTPGILGTPGFSYFHQPLATTTTPVARRRSSSHALREKSSVSTLAPTSIGTSRPSTRGEEAGEGIEGGGEGGGEAAGGTGTERRPDDVQAAFRIRYAGDVRMNVTAEILLDYPMPSFVGIPLKLNITGLAFDGVGVLAQIRRRVHFCFLGPEDAVAAVGGVDEEETDAGSRQNMDAGTGSRQNMDASGAGGGLSHGSRFGGLLQEIRVESEIGERDGGKQSLKNVGKVERFVLEQVRRIFDEEFVYPSFWTFLV